MIIYYGGAFDPPTLAHEFIVRTIEEKVVKQGDRFLIGVSNNDEKYYQESILNRYNLARAAFGNNKEYVIQKERMYSFIKNNFGDENVAIVIGADEYERLFIKHEWENSEELISDPKISFVLFSRGEVTPELQVSITEVCANNNVVLSEHEYYRQTEPKITPFFLYKAIPQVSSSKTREILFAKDECKRDNIIKYISDSIFTAIQEAHLYQDYYAEKEVLRNYDPNKYVQPSVTATIAVYDYSLNHVVLIKRKSAPYKNFWALPGGFFEPQCDKTIVATAARELYEETGLDIKEKRFRFVRYYDAVNLDPRCRIIDMLFAVRLDQNEGLSFLSKIHANDDAVDIMTCAINDLPATMAFHHKNAVETGRLIF